MEKLEKLLSELWQDYVRNNSQALPIHKALSGLGGKVVNDHIAFRTFNLSPVNVDAIAKIFLSMGYIEKGQYDFEEKKLFAKHYEHPDDKYPLIFISELLLENFSEFLQSKIKSLVDSITPEAFSQWDFLASGNPWPMISHEDYQLLLKESEYAAWTATFGYCANHFTVLANAIPDFKNLDELNGFIKKMGYPLNTSGGEVKGSPQDYLEQSSTLADPLEVVFSDGPQKVPCCYYEFAWRFAMTGGDLFKGFVAKSADKIFESTKPRDKLK